MSYVFISYKREDELRAGRLARALEAEGIEVWWDRGLPGGESWHTNIEAKLQLAGCVVVVWSQNSAGLDGGYVREEARRGLSRGILVPVLIDKLTDLPLGFGEIQALDLTAWHGNSRDPFFQDLVATVRAKLRGAPLPAPVGPTRRIANRLIWGGASSAALAFAALFAFNTFGLASGLCGMPGPQPGLSDSCGQLGLGNRPSRTERLAWEARQPGSCSALREYISRFPDGVLRRKAADLLTARRVTAEETWAPSQRTLALFEPTPETPVGDETAAKASALENAKSTAGKLCRDFGAGTLYRFVSATPVADTWRCKKAHDGVRCEFEGRADCELTEKKVVERETCN